MTRECVGVMPIAHSGHEFIGNISPTQQLSDQKCTDILHGELSFLIILVLLLVSSLYPFVTTTTKTFEQGVSGTELRPVIDYFDAEGNKDLYHPMVRSSKIKTSSLYRTRFYLRLLMTIDTQDCGIGVTVDTSL